jgi:glyoxylase-like metal-dependent hydrolase (beta-lactamase superfamily II)
MLLRPLTVGVIQTNCYIVGCEETRQGAVIDPGGDGDRIMRVVEESGLDICYVLITHAHMDHIGATAEVVQATGGKLAIHPAEIPLLKMNGGASWFGLAMPPAPSPDIELEEGQVLEVGTLRFQVLFVPGHSPGHVAFYEAGEGVVFDGDVVFAMGIGRTDLPGGDWNTLMRSIREVLLALPDETVIYPGHGPKTTVGHEKTHNPWL